MPPGSAAPPDPRNVFHSDGSLRFNSFPSSIPTFDFSHLLEFSLPDIQQEICIHNRNLQSRITICQIKPSIIFDPLQLRNRATIQ